MRPGDGEERGATSRTRTQPRGDVRGASDSTTADDGSTMPPINYVDPPDIPEGMTCSEWRRGRSAPARRRLLVVISARTRPVRLAALPRRLRRT